MQGQEVKPQKAVLISIQPKWCEKIAAKWKTMELRKSMPNIPVPFKCYIYQTRHSWAFKLLRSLKLYNLSDTLAGGFGKVIGEFVCDHILGHCEMANADIAEYQSKVRRDKILEYSGGKEVYGWHISDLVIYDDPKPLSEFHRPAPPVEELDDKLCNYCRPTGYGDLKSVNTPNGVQMCEGRWCDDAYTKYIENNCVLYRPPQSWCYVEAQ